MTHVSLIIIKIYLFATLFGTNFFLRQIQLTDS